MMDDRLSEATLEGTYLRRHQVVGLVSAPSAKGCTRGRQSYGNPRRHEQRRATARRPRTARTHMASALLSARDALREYTSRAQLPSRVAFATRRANICQSRRKPPPVRSLELACRAPAQHASAGSVHRSAGNDIFSAFSGDRNIIFF